MAERIILNLDEAGCADMVFSLQTTLIGKRFDIAPFSFSYKENGNGKFNVSGPGGKATEYQKGPSTYGGTIGLTLGNIRKIKNNFLVPGFFNPSLIEISKYHSQTTLIISPINGKLNEINTILYNFKFNTDGIEYIADTSDTMKVTIDFINCGQG